MAFGEMDMSVDEYYNMLPSHFAAKCKGYTAKVNRDRSDLRRVAFFTIWPHMKDGFNEDRFNKIWPLPIDKQIQESDIDPQMPTDLWEKMQKRLSKHGGKSKSKINRTGK